MKAITTALTVAGLLAIPTLLIPYVMIGLAALVSVSLPYGTAVALVALIASLILWAAVAQLMTVLEGLTSQDTG